MTRLRRRIPRTAAALTAIALVALVGTGTAQGGFAGRDGDIAFDSLRTGDWDLFVMKADGSDERRLDASAAGATDARPAWAPDAGVGAFTGAAQYPGGFDIFPLNGPVGQRVGLFGRGLSDLPQEIVGVLFNGTRATQFGRDVNGAFAVVPQGATTGQVCVEVRPLERSAAIVSRAGSFIDFSVDGGGVPTGPPEVRCPSAPIAFQSDRSGDFDLWAADSGRSAGAGNPIDLLPWPGSDETAPAWSSASGQEFASRPVSLLAFVSDIDGSRDLWILNPYEPLAPGTNPAQLTDWPGIETNPDWAPDGRSIAFESDADGQHDIWIVDVLPNVAGGYFASNPRKVTQDQPPSHEPSWFSYRLVSPSQEQLAFSGPDEDASCQINYVEQPVPESGHFAFEDTSNLTPETLPEGPAKDDSPAYSPRGGFVAFHGAGAGNDDIWRYDRSDGVSARLTESTAPDRHPTWQGTYLEAAVTFYRPWGRRKPRRRKHLMTLALARQVAPEQPGCAEPPRASLSARPAKVKAGGAVTFDARASRDPDGTVAAYAWDLDGNGSYELTSGPAVVTRPASVVGRRIARVRITDDEGFAAVAQASYEVEANVQPSLCTVIGTDGPDVLAGTPGPDVICGRGGNDVLRGGDGDDVMSGGPGNDRVQGQRGDDLIDGDDGRDTLTGGGGDDVISGNAGSDNLRGGGGKDDLRGSAGDDRLTGGASDDVVSGSRGDDDLRGNAGADVLAGGRGKDRLHGGGGRDRLRGDGGPDRIIARDGARDRVSGGPGTDRAKVDGELDRVRQVEVVDA